MRGARRRAGRDRSVRLPARGRFAVNARVRFLVLLAVCSVASSVLTACSSDVAAAPACNSIERLATIAQSVPTSSYVPCVSELSAGWTSADLDVHDGGTRFSLHSDRSARAVTVEFGRDCDTSTATPIVARTE